MIPETIIAMVTEQEALDAADDHRSGNDGGPEPSLRQHARRANVASMDRLGLGVLGCCGNEVTV